MEISSLVSCQWYNKFTFMAQKVATILLKEIKFLNQTLFEVNLFFILTGNEDEFLNSLMISFSFTV